MTIRYKCEECGAALNINDELAGTEGSCPRCHVEFIVPSVDAAGATPDKAEKPRSTGALNTEDEIGDFLSSDEIPVATGKTSLAESDDADSYADDNPFDDDSPRSRGKVADDDPGDEEEEERSPRTKKQAVKPQEGGKGAKRETVNAAAFAKSLMGKGQPVVEEEPEPGKKKKRRQFGEGSDRPEGELTSVRDVATYFVKMGWPALLGVVVVIGLCIYVFMKMQKKLDVPPLALVSGTVTIDGKPVAASTIVQFLPVDAATNTKLGPSVGFTDPNGKYTLQYTNEHAGAVIGRHYVLIQPSDPTQRIPGRYATTAGELQKEVTKDGKPIDIELKSDPVPEQ